jgi:hypothetical protein
MAHWKMPSVIGTKAFGQSRICPKSPWQPDRPTTLHALVNDLFAGYRSVNNWHRQCAQRPTLIRPRRPSANETQPGSRSLVSTVLIHRFDRFEDSTTSQKAASSSRFLIT